MPSSENMTGWSIEERVWLYVRETAELESGRCQGADANAERALWQGDSIQGGSSASRA